MKDVIPCCQVLHQMCVTIRRHWVIKCRCGVLITKTQFKKRLDLNENGDGSAAGDIRRGETARPVPDVPLMRSRFELLKTAQHNENTELKQKTQVHYDRESEPPVAPTNTARSESSVLYKSAYFQRGKARDDAHPACIYV